MALIPLTMISEKKIGKDFRTFSETNLHVTERITALYMFVLKTIENWYYLFVGFCHGLLGILMYTDIKGVR